MTIEQKLRDEYWIGYLEGVEEGRAEALRLILSELKGILDPATIAERFEMPIEQVMDILDQA